MEPEMFDPDELTDFDLHRGARRLSSYSCVRPSEYWEVHLQPPPYQHSTEPVSGTF